MRTIFLPAAYVAVLAMGMARPAQAASYQTSFTAAGTCQLSIPSIDTQVRAKASGYRNEGTTNAFVICSPLAPVYNHVTAFRYYLVSMDGAAHSVSCTGTSGNTGESFTYSAKTVSATTGYGSEVRWAPADFGDTTYIDSGQGHLAMTCNLPPNVAINMGYLNYDLP